MKFLIDECLSPELVKLVQEKGHGESTHVVRSGSRLVSLQREWRSAQERLTTLDATIGVAYAEIVAAIARHSEQLAIAQQSLTNVEGELQQSVIDVTGAKKDRESAAAARSQPFDNGIGPDARALDSPCIRM